MANSIVDRSQVLTLLGSQSEFPVDFDHAWQWLGYANKRNAADCLKSNFEEGLEFSRTTAKSPNGGRPSVSYHLTNDCFKMLAMVAGTEKGKEVRRYYLDCEKQLKEQNAPKALPAVSIEERIGMLGKAFETFKIDDSPRHLQLAQDHVANLLGANENSALLPSSEPVWEGIAEIAEGLGYKPHDVFKVRSKLGRAAAEHFRYTTGTEPGKEKRIVNGRAVNLMVYQADEDICDLVHGFMSDCGYAYLTVI